MGDDANADRTLRGMTNDGAFRVVTARTTELVAEAVARQSAGVGCAEAFGEVLTGAILVRETMAPSQRLQALFATRDRRGRLVADTHPDGTTRGLVTLKEGVADLDVAGGSLEMMRTLHNGELHRGVVEVPEGGGVSQALMTYMSASEQVATMIAVACVMEGERVAAAGGYIVQLLPEVGTAPLAVMTERLRDFETIGPLLETTDANPSKLLDELLWGMEFTRLDESPVAFGCQCSTVRVLASLATVGRDELERMIADGEVLDIDCDYCGQGYRVSPNQLRGLLEQS